METIVDGMRPIHPGEILREEFLIPMGLSAHALATLAGALDAIRKFEPAAA